MIVAGAPRSYRTTSPVAPAASVTPFRIARSRASASGLISERNVRIVPVSVTSAGNDVVALTSVDRSDRDHGWLVPGDCPRSDCLQGLTNCAAVTIGSIESSGLRAVRLAPDDLHLPCVRCRQRRAFRVADVPDGHLRERVETKDRLRPRILQHALLDHQ